jgi:CHASE3 domain sensor protein
MSSPTTKPEPLTDQSGRAFSRKIQTGFWLVGAILLCIGLASYLSIREFEETVDWVTHSQEVLGRLQVVLSDVQNLEIGLRGYVMTGKERFLGPYENGLGLLSRHREDLSTIIQVTPQDPPDQPRNLEMLNVLIDAKLALSKTMLALR